MIRLEETLRARRDAGRKLLVPYVTGGLGPDWTEIVMAVAAAGADAIEIGIPFSDPVMDGPTIQEASMRALEGGATPPGVLGALPALEAGVPMAAMTYYNIVFRTGTERFARLLTENGVSGAILPDLPLEELDEWATAAERAGVETVLLVSPVTPDDRVAHLCRRSHGFVYGVSLMGVTGERQTLSETAAVVAKRLKAATDKPVLMGLGVSTPDQAVEVAEHADGVIVGSALMRIVLDGGGPDAVADLVAAMRRALDS